MYFTDSKRGLLVRHDNGVTTEVHDKSMDELTTMIGGFPQTQLNMFHDLLTRIIDDIGKVNCPTATISAVFLCDNL